MESSTRSFARYIPWLLLLPLGGIAQSALSSASRLQEALSALEQSTTRTVLVRQAMRQWKLSRASELEYHFRWGQVSRTDAVLTRHFDPRTGQEQRERQVTIFIREDQSYEDLVLDLAHEMTHALAGPTWDPYDPDLTAAKYIRASIDGEGGEVEALQNECRVARELRFGRGASGVRCARYENRASGKIDPEKIRHEIYRVGSRKRELMRKLGLEAELLPLLSSDAPLLFSSTGRAPYPLSLLQEYEEITEVACENSAKRLEALPGRSPASLNPFRENAERFLAHRCETR